MESTKNEGNSFKDFLKGLAAFLIMGTIGVLYLSTFFIGHFLEPYRYWIIGFGVLGFSFSIVFHTLLGCAKNYKIHNILKKLINGTIVVLYIVSILVTVICFILLFILSAGSPSSDFGDSTDNVII